jgi:cyclohexanone monooxygenase
MTTAPNKPTVAIVGAGLGGITMGIQLAHRGYDFTIFDCGDDFGGIWRKNAYPGAACDVPSHFYFYSFALNPRWSKTFDIVVSAVGMLEGALAEFHQFATSWPVTACPALRAAKEGDRPYGDCRT